MTAVGDRVRELEHVVRDREQQGGAENHRERGDRGGEVDTVGGVEPAPEERSDEASRPGDRVVEAERPTAGGPTDQANEEEGAGRADERPSNPQERVEEREPDEERGRPEAEQDVDRAPEEQEHQDDTPAERFEEDRLRGVGLDRLPRMEEEGRGGRRRAQVDDEDPRVRELRVLP